MTDQPGIRERHLLRKLNNPLFGDAHDSIGKDDLAQARLHDGLDKDRFLSTFQNLVERAVNLEPNAPSETVLEIKEQLDQSYEQACSLPGDMSTIKQSIDRLVAVIMDAVRAGAGGDQLAQQQLDEEVVARREHYRLQELPLVAALTHPDSPVGPHELIPSLLSEDTATLADALSIFDEQQLASIVHDAGVFLQQRDPAHQLTDAWSRLQLIEDRYRNRQPAHPPN